MQLLQHAFMTEELEQPNVPVPVSACDSPPSSTPAAGVEVEAQIVEQSNAAQLKLALTLSIGGESKVVQFPFSVESDTPEGVASEMLDELGLSRVYMAQVSAEIDRVVSAF